LGHNNRGAWLVESPLETFIGAAAAICTTCSYIPQLRKCWATGEAGDLSLKMLLLLAGGLLLWMAYGMMRGDAVIMVANGVSLALLACILYFKVRESYAPGHGSRH
jgi:MtN3 and saliva related transmembrane protein